jgi:hypothetical protein
VENTGRFSVAAPRNWTSKLVRQFNYVSNLTTQAIEFWLDSVLGGYVIGFLVNCTQSYCVAEREFFKGLCERLLKSLNTWIKMCLCENNVMVMKYDC